MTVPVSVQQRIRVLDAHGMSWRSIAKEVGVAVFRQVGVSCLVMYFFRV